MEKKVKKKKNKAVKWVIVIVVLLVVIGGGIGACMHFVTNAMTAGIRDARYVGLYRNGRCGCK